MKPGEWIGVDLDGTLAKIPNNAGWWPPDMIGDPVPAMVARVKRWLAEGKEVRIFTARVDGGIGSSLYNCPPEVAELYQNVAYVKACIEEWCLQHIGQVLPITNVKDCGMVELWDDRAVQVMPNKGITIAESITKFIRDCFYGAG
jgi:hypothetical protein